MPIRTAKRKGMESRAIVPGSSISVRDAVAGKPLQLFGHAAKFNVESSPLYDPWVGDSQFVERIAKGAFARTLKENGDIRALYNHDTSGVLGRTGNGSLRLWEDEIGLAFEDDLPDTAVARDAHCLVMNGYIDGCSFGFMTIEDSIEVIEGRVIRTLLDVELYEISPAVGFPAYDDTSVSARSRSNHRKIRPFSDLERLKSRSRLAGVIFKP